MERTKTSKMDRIILNLSKIPRSKTMIFAMAHRGMAKVTDPQLQSRLYSYTD